MQGRVGQHGRQGAWGDGLSDDRTITALGTWADRGRKACSANCVEGLSLGLIHRRPLSAGCVRQIALTWGFTPPVLSYRDVEELLPERGIVVDHVTISRWVQRVTPLVIDAAGPCRHCPGDRWFVDETYVKVAGRWRYVYRVIDQFGQVIDVLVSEKRELAATRRFFTHALRHGIAPTEVTTDRAQAYPRVLDEPLPAGCHVLEKYANNPIETDHGRLKSRLRPMRGLTRLRCARVIATGHAFIQNIRRGHDELGVEEPPTLWVAAAFTELALAI